MELKLDQHLEFRPKRDGRIRPMISGTRVEVAYLVADSERHGMSAEEIASGYDNVSIADVHAALAYYHDNRDEFRRMMREDAEFNADLRRRLEEPQSHSDGSRPISH